MENLCISILEFKCWFHGNTWFMGQIYVFLYQNLNMESGTEGVKYGDNLCISILEFKQL